MKYMMATKALHMLGDISRNKPDLCRVFKEDGDNYIGVWVFGLGFCDVKFPKATTRELTDEEVDHYHNTGVAIYGAFSGQPSGQSYTLDVKGADNELSHAMPSAQLGDQQS